MKRARRVLRRALPVVALAVTACALGRTPLGKVFAAHKRRLVRACTVIATGCGRGCRYGTKQHMNEQIKHVKRHYVFLYYRCGKYEDTIVKKFRRPSNGSPKHMCWGRDASSTFVHNSPLVVTREGRGPASRFCSTEQNIAPAFKSRAQRAGVVLPRHNFSLRSKLCRGREREYAS